MGGKVVPGGDMFFKDDIKIDDDQLTARLDMPDGIPVFGWDELTILYQGRMFVATRERTLDSYIKIYTQMHRLKEVEKPKLQEDHYFSTNRPRIKELKEDLIQRSVSGMISNLGDAIAQELTEKVDQLYGPLGGGDSRAVPPKLIQPNNDGSLFNTYMTGLERSLFLDGKHYHLCSIKEHVQKFKRAFEPNFYVEVMDMIDTATPEEISALMTEKKDFMHPKALPLCRNPIWHSERSSKILLDGQYWIPEYVGKADGILTTYQQLLERKVKHDAIREYK